MKFLKLAFIYKKNVQDVFIYKNPDTSQKARQFGLSFYVQKAWHFTLRDFHKKIEFGIYIKEAWQFPLRDVFIYKNPDTSQKAIQFALRFYIKIWTLCFTQFLIEFLKLAEVGGIFYIQNTMHYALYFYIRKTIHFAVRYYIQKTLHFALHFYIQETILLLKRALGIPYVNRIDFFCFLFISKRFAKQNCFLYMNEYLNACHQRETTCTFIYIL